MRAIYTFPVLIWLAFVGARGQESTVICSTLEPGLQDCAVGLLSPLAYGTIQIEGPDGSALLIENWFGTLAMLPFGAAGIAEDPNVPAYVSANIGLFATQTPDSYIAAWFTPPGYTEPFFAWTSTSQSPTLVSLGTSLNAASLLPPGGTIVSEPTAPSIYNDSFESDFFAAPTPYLSSTFSPLASSVVFEAVATFDYYPENVVYMLSSTAPLTPSPAVIDWSYPPGGVAPGPVNVIPLTGASSYSASVTSGSPWLLLAPKPLPNGFTPQASLSNLPVNSNGFNVYFNPLATPPPGNSIGAIALTDSSGNQATVTVHLASFSPCDVNRDGLTNVGDVQNEINQALGNNAPANDLNDDGAVNVVDVQIVTDASLNLACTAASPAIISLATAIERARGGAVDRAGNVYTADAAHGRVNKRTPVGAMSTIAAGVGFGRPAGVEIDGAGDIYVADSEANRIFRVAPNGATSIVAEGLNHPAGMAVDRAGNLYFADTYAQTIRKIGVRGTMTVVAGNGTASDAGDGGPATQAGLYDPGAVAVDAAGNLYIADFGNDRIREVSAGGVIRTVAQIPHPSGIAVDFGGNLYIAERDSDAIRKIAPDGAISVIGRVGR